MRAGLIPALQGGKPLAHSTQLPKGSARWAVHVITPTARTLQSLAASLTRDSESVSATATLIDDLAQKGPRLNQLDLVGRGLANDAALPSGVGEPRRGSVHRNHGRGFVGGGSCDDTA